VLTEAATWLSDRTDPVPDKIWEEAARHYSEPQLAALVVSIVSGDWVEQLIKPRAGQPA
jgi:hypothetical protein